MEEKKSRDLEVLLSDGLSSDEEADPKKYRIESEIWKQILEYERKHGPYKPETEEHVKAKRLMKIRMKRALGWD